MIAYASNTGTRRNLSELRKHDWRILLTPTNARPQRGLRFAIDNGAWSAYRSGTPFNAKAFQRLVERHGAAADFTIAPDIVAGGLRSLDFSLSWMERLRGIHVLLPLQDGMTAERIGEVLNEYPALGLFLGGSTEWKIQTMLAWGMVAHAFKRYYHVGRVNTRRRIRLCHEAGAHSFDGTSASMFSVNVCKMTEWKRQPNLFAGRW